MDRLVKSLVAIYILSQSRMQFQGKRIVQTQKNDRNPHFRPDLWPSWPAIFTYMVGHVTVGPKFGPPNFFFKILVTPFIRYRGQL